MKIRWIALVILLVSSLLTSQVREFTFSTDDDLQRVEELKPEESEELAKAHGAVDKAEANLERVERKICAQHGMRDESYPEWYSWSAIHGKYILHYSHTNMRFPAAIN